MNARRFATDKMLGRLAMWLRLVGIDTSYGSHLAGPTLVRHARAQGRTILTRDRRLVRTRNLPPYLLIDSDHFREQLRQVIDTFDLAPCLRPGTRCSRCNVPLQPIAKQAVAPQVPPYVLATQESFVTCPSCHRIYWPATHYERIREELRRLGLIAPVPADSGQPG